MMMVTISGPSIWGDDVMTTKQSAAQNRVRSTHWVFVSGLRMDICIGDGLIKNELTRVLFIYVEPCQLVN